MTPKSYVHPVIVLGAGPAGLSCCYELIRRGIEPLVLEKGVAGNSFAAFPRNIFFGPWLNNLLPGSAIDWAWLLKRSTQPAYTKYLQDYAHQNRLPVKTGVEVLRVEQKDGIFRIQTSAGEFHCHVLVNATGYFQAPFTPPYPGLETTQVPHIHVCQYREPADVEKLVGRRAGRVLVVGKRLSAGETFVELHNAGYQMSLSYRGKLRFGPSQWGEALFSPLQWIVERLAVALRLRRHSYPRMAGGESQRLIRQGQVNQYADIERFESDHVVFSDGRKERFDLVIFATGYRPAVSHLRDLLPSGTERPRVRNMESQDTPGLFFLGLDQQRTYRSRFLRGIVEDSRLLAELVARRCSRVVIQRPQGVQELAAPQTSLVTN